jgi:phosphoribosylamine---glycine ligase
MNILFVSKELIAVDLAYQLKKEGCAVKLYIENKDDKNCLDGMIEKTDDWKKELKWVKKEGLVIFDDVGYGKIQDNLRREGYLVIGGSGDGDRLELDRKYGQEMLKLSGVKIDDDFETKSFTVDFAIKFIRKHKGKWVLKQDNHDEALTCIGETEDGSDIINILENYRNHFGNAYHIALQKRVCGIEIAIGRFFNGKNWIGPLVFNIEHKNFCNDDIGPLGGETGTLMWYENDEKKKLFQKTLSKLKPQLQRSNYHGYVDINCIVTDKKTVYPLEITSRFGSSTNEMQSEIQKSLWSDLLLSLAKGENYHLQYKKGYGITVALTVPPFPYKTSDKKLSQKGINIFFKKELSKEEFEHIHFEEVAFKREKKIGSYFIAGNSGYILYITGLGKNVSEARKKVHAIINKIIIPKMFYRTDIGSRFIKKDRKLLKKWGWI